MTHRRTGRGGPYTAAHFEALVRRVLAGRR